MVVYLSSLLILTDLTDASGRMAQSYDRKDSLITWVDFAQQVDRPELRIVTILVWVGFVKKSQRYPDQLQPSNVNPGRPKSGRRKYEGRMDMDMDTVCNPSIP